MIHVDTNLFVFLAAGQLDRIPQNIQAMLPSASLIVSPMVPLELQYLHEVGRLTENGREVFERVRLRLDVRISELPMHTVVAHAHSLSWTRDPFDRLIVAGALADDQPLVTADKTILKQCPNAVWSRWRRPTRPSVR